MSGGAFARAVAAKAVPRSHAARAGVALVTSGAAAAAAAGWRALDSADARAIAADPEHDALFRPLSGGRPLAATAADGTALHAEVFGPDDAPTIVLVHGWTCGLRFWTRQIQDLAGRWRLVAYDLRGHGESGTPQAGDFSIDALGDDVEAVLDAAAPDGGGPVVLAGHSLGAMSIVSWAARHPASLRRRAAGVALLNTGMGDLVSESLVVRMPSRLGRLQAAVGRTVLGARAPLPPDSPVTRRVVRHVALSPQASPAQVAFCAELVLGSRRDARAGCGRGLSRLDLYEAVRDVAVPALVVAGERDRLTPPPHAHRLAEALPQHAGTVMLPGVGHMAPIEAAGEVTEALDGFAASMLHYGRDAAAGDSRADEKLR